MNTQLRDPIDHQLRALMRTAVADAPMSPTVADVERGRGVRAAPPIEPRHTVRWLSLIHI